MRTYSIKPHGKKFETNCRTDGYWSISYLSKNTKRARQKGEEFVSGQRTAMRKFTTAYGRAINEEKSRNRNATNAQLAAAVWGTLEHNR